MALRHAVVSTGIPSLPETCYISICNIFVLGGQFIGTPVLSDTLTMTLQLCGNLHCMVLRLQVQGAYQPFGAGIISF